MGAFDGVAVLTEIGEARGDAERPLPITGSGVSFQRGELRFHIPMMREHSRPSSELDRSTAEYSQRDKGYP